MYEDTSSFNTPSFFKNFAYFIEDVFTGVGQGQGRLLAQLSAFLKLTSPNVDEELLDSLKKGHCDGLARIHGGMEQIQKLLWWEAALVEVCCWDGTLASLEQMVLLPEADDEQPIPLKKIINRVLNYVVGTHATFKGVKVKGINCINHFEPNHFEISSNSAQLVSKHNIKFGGYFSKQRLLELLHEDYFQDGFCCVSNGAHAIRIGYLGDNKWVIYDPNYAHNKRRPILKILSKERMIDELSKIQGNSLTLDFVHFKKLKIHPYMQKRYDHLLEHHLVELLQKQGMHQILREIPGYLPMILKKAERNKDVARALVKGLTNIPAKITKSLLKGIVEDESHHLKRFLKLIRKTKGGEAALKIAIGDLANPGWKGYSTLSVVAIHNPKLFPQLIKLLKSVNAIGPNVVAKSFAVCDEKCKKPGLMWINEKVPEHVPALLELAMQAHDGYQYLCAALAAGIKQDSSQKTPATYEYCFQYVNKNTTPNSALILATLFDDQYYERYKILFLYPSLLSGIIYNHKDHFKKMVSLMQSDASCGANIVDFLTDASVPQALLFAVLNEAPQLIELAMQDKDGLTDLCEVLGRKLENHFIHDSPQNQTKSDVMDCFYYLLARESKSIPVFVSAIVESKDPKKNVLLSKHPDWLLAIAHHYPESFVKLLRSMDHDDGFVFRDLLLNHLSEFNKSNRIVIAPLIDFAIKTEWRAGHLLYCLAQRDNNKTILEQILDHKDQSTLPAILESIHKATQSYCEKQVLLAKKSQLPSLAGNLVVTACSLYFGGSELFPIRLAGFCVNLVQLVKVLMRVIDIIDSFRDTHKRPDPKRIEKIQKQLGDLAQDKVSTLSDKRPQFFPTTQDKKTPVLPQSSLPAKT